MIDPVSLPNAAGLNFGEGDVRHFSEEEALSTPNLQNPTRQLAFRDVLLAKKVNEVISTVNNKEQFVPLPVLRTVISPGTEETISNFRIPKGFEARVLNATISSTPVSSDIELNVIWAAGFGNTTGTNVVTTSNEFTGGVQFSPQGEFIIVVKNKGAVTVDTVASVLVTMRPLGGFAGVLVGNISVQPGEPGQPGPKGDPGSGGKGDPGPPGQPGLIYRGDWAATTVYSPNDTVTHNFAGTSGVSSFIARVAHTASTGNQPAPFASPTTEWKFLAQAGAAGSGSSIPGPGGGFGTFATTTVSGTFTTGSDFVGDNYDVAYESLSMSPSTSYLIPISETYAGTSSAATNDPKGVAILAGSFRTHFKGAGTITMPKKIYGAKLDYHTGFINCNVAMHGTSFVEVNASGTMVKAVTLEKVPSTTDKYVVQVLSGNPVMLEFTFFGAQTVLA